MTTATLNTISPGELKQLLDSGEHIELIDVRTPLEFQEVHITAARNVPLDRLKPTQFLQDRTGNPGSPVYVVCRTGTRGQMACKDFEAAGFSNAINVTGGTEACVAEGIPVARGKKTMSLERQVRIAAGAIVLTGAVLAQFVHPGFIWLSGFVGAGLVFSGITDTCAMGMMVARMPWNQCASGQGPSGGCSTKA